MNHACNHLDTDGTSAPRGGCVSSLPFGAIKGPGASARKYTRSCRCTLARRQGGSTSVSAHTNLPVHVRTGCLIVTDTRSSTLVGGSSRPSMKASPNRLRPRSGFCAAFGNRKSWPVAVELRRPIGGPGSRNQSVASAMTSSSRKCRPVAGGYLALSARAGARRPTSFAEGTP